MPLLLRSTIDLVRGRFISLGLQKLVHVRTLNKMTTAACQEFLTVDGIEPSDVKKLTTLNFDRYPIRPSLSRCVPRTATVRDADLLL